MSSGQHPAEPTQSRLQLIDSVPITYSAALKTDRNLLHEAHYVEATIALYRQLWKSRTDIVAVTKHHLGLSDRDACSVAPPRDWIRGSFNVCIPIEVQSPNTISRLILRCPLAHKLAEAVNPGSVDEKLSCEVGTYVWMQDKCADIRIPHLYGFGFTDLRQFTHEQHRPLYVRLAHGLRRFLRSILGYEALLSHYVPHRINSHLTTGYILLEDIRCENSEMLSQTWNEKRADSRRRKNLYRGISRIMLSLARIPLPRIGSFSFQDNGTITLSNRPANSTMLILENEGSPRALSTHSTYQQTERFVSDLLQFHDQRFLTHPNAICGINDCHGEMASSVMLRAISHHFIQTAHRDGPFFLQLDDLHPSNIFVDGEWNVTSLIDLEWVCALPVEMFAAPYWLSGLAIDQLKGEKLAEFEQLQEEFWQVFEQEEHESREKSSLSLVQTMRQTWATRAVWFWRILMSTNAKFPLFTHHLCPVYSPSLMRADEALLSRFWSPNADGVAALKVQEYQDYVFALRRLFQRQAIVPRTSQ